MVIVDNVKFMFPVDKENLETILKVMTYIPALELSCGVTLIRTKNFDFSYIINKKGEIIIIDICNCDNDNTPVFDLKSIA